MAKDIDLKNNAAKASSAFRIDAYNREIAEQIKSGEYFRDALMWYDEKYHAPIIEKAYLIVITLVAVLSTMFAVQGFISFWPPTVRSSLTISVPDADNNEYFLQKIAERTAHTNSALLTYFVNEYVLKRERYWVQMLERDVIRIRAGSTPEVFAEYRTFLSPANPESPITKYERHSRRDIEILNVKYDVSGADAEHVVPKQAVVRFRAVAVGAGSEEGSEWKATIGFDYKPVTVNQESFEVSPMEFKVTSYRVEPFVSP